MGGTSSGGSGGSAGQTGSAGGTSGTAGTVGNAGSASGGSGTATQVYTFQSALEGFAVNRYCTGPVANANCMTGPAQLPPPPADAGTDAGESPDATPPAEPPPANAFVVLDLDDAVGDANAGSARLTFQFTAGYQAANFAINFGSMTVAGINLTGKAVRAQVRAEPGAPATAFAKMYIKTGSTYYYADSGQVTLVAGNWTPITFDTGVPPSYAGNGTLDPNLYSVADVRELGMEIGATAVAAPAAAVIHIDTVSY